MEPKKKTPETPKIPARSARSTGAGVGAASPVRRDEPVRWLVPQVPPCPPSSPAPPWSVLRERFPQASWEPSGKEVNLQQKVVLCLELLPSDASRVREMLLLVSQWAWQAGAQCWVPNVGCSTASLVPPAPSGPP